MPSPTPGILPTSVRHPSRVLRSGTQPGSVCTLPCRTHICQERTRRWLLLHICLAAMLFMTSYHFAIFSRLRQAVRKPQTGQQVTEDIPTHDVTTIIPPNIIFCSKCKPPLLNRTTVFRRPSAVDVEDGTAISFIPISSASGYDICHITRPHILIAVTSPASHSAQRNAIRRTWGRLAATVVPRTRLVFTVPVRPDERGTAIILAKENDFLRDIVSYTTVPEAANRSVFNVPFLLSWLGDCKDVKFVMRVNDDTFVNVRLLAHVYQQVIYSNATVLGRFEDPRMNQATLEGCTYMLNASSLQKLNMASADVLLNVTEGEYLTQLVRKAGLRLAALPIITSCEAKEREFNPCDAQTMLTLRPANHRDMRDLTMDVKGGMNCLVNDDPGSSAVLIGKNS